MFDQSSLRAFSRFPFLWLVAAFSSGIIVAKFVSIPLWAALPVCILAALGAVSTGRSYSGGYVLLAFFAAGAAAYALDVPASQRIRSMFERGAIGSREPLEVRGVLVAEPEDAVGGRFIEVSVDSVVVRGARQRATGRVKLFAPAANQEIESDYRNLGLGYGDVVDIVVRLDRDENFRNPGTVSRIAQLDAQSIDAAGTIKSPFLITKLEAGGGPFEVLYRARKSLIGAFREAFGVSTAGVLIASLLGNKQFLDRETAELFRDGGTFHILVISGLHITFIGGLIVAILHFLRQSRWRQLLIAGSMIWAYAIAVGAEVPVVRAALMFSVVLFARAIYRDGNLLNLFGMCAFAILVWRPSELFSPSFQLTFVSVGAIVAAAFPLIEKMRAIGEWRPTAEHPFPPSAPPLLIRFCESIYWRSEIWEIDSRRNIWSANLLKSGRAKFAPILVRYFFEGVVVSLIVQAALLPLSVCYFNRVAFGSVALNLWVGFLLAIESFAGLAALVVSLFSEYAAVPLVALTDALNSVLLFGPRMFAAFGLGGFRSPVYTGPFQAVYVLFYFPLIVLAWRLNRWNPFELAPQPRVRNGRMITAAVCLVAIVAFHPFSAPRADGRLRVDFIDVGQGDSALVTFPNGETMLIDGGGRPNYQRLSVERVDGTSEPFEPDRMTIGEAVVSRFLWHRGLSRVDYLVATHADADHIQGLADVARNFAVRNVFIGREAPDDPDFRALVSVLRAKAIPVSEVRRGALLDIGGARVEVLHPTENGVSSTGNNESVVLRIIFGERSFLFTGDIESDAERNLIADGIDIRADVVKVPHHGSRTSSVAAFIARTRAVYALIPVGLESPFGHPDGEVVERWRDSGAIVTTTGESGTATFSTDGRDLLFDSFVK
ncbi:MAG: ComEC/Rec2 family competence protein [Acidobacteria bacterium]|nr:ComEC/Rec2 family competence protein [Acidobacteriota bacterium]